MTTPRGAKPLTAATPVDAALDGQLLAARNQELAVMNAQQQAAIDQFGDGLPWSMDHYEAEIRHELRRGCESFLRAGRYLVVVREFTTHGEWTGMLGRLGIEPRQAQRMMEAARRVTALSNASTSTHLLRAAESSGKLIELLSLPEDQFTELATDGETGSLSLEDVEKMTVRELRAAVRDARADIEAKDDRAAKRERDIETLQKQVRQLKGHRAKAAPDELVTELRSLASAAALQVRADIGATGEDVDSLQERFGALREQALAAGDAEGRGDEHDAFMAGLIGELLGELRRVRDAFGLPIINDHGAPSWQQGV